MDIISYSLASQALTASKKAGFVGDKQVDQTNLGDKKVLSYNATKGMYELVDAPTAATIHDVGNFTATTSADGTQVTLNWTNPSSFTVRELYVSITNILNADRAACNSSATLLDGTIGTGNGNADSFIYSSTPNTTYYFKIFVSQDIAGTTFFSSGKSLQLTSTETIPPADVTGITAQAGDKNVVIKWTDPTDADWAGTKVVRKTGSYPANENDGVLVVNSTVRNQYSSIGFTDSSVTNGTQYYYQLFPYDVNGNINRDIVNQISALPTANYPSWGVSWNKTADTYQRLGQAATDNVPLLSNTDIYSSTNTINAINYFNTKSPWKNIRRCNLSDTGVVNAYYGDASYKDDGTNGMVMVEIPSFSYKLVTTASGYEFWISDPGLAGTNGFSVHPAFYRDRTNSGTASIVNYRYFSAYDGFYNSATSKLESKSSVAPTGAQPIATFRTQAQARGNGWGIVDFNLLYAIQLLYLVEYGHFDSQSKIGKGFTDGLNSTPTTTGKTSSLGNSSGNESNTSDGKHAMSYRGIENLYGNIDKFIDGIVTSGTSGSTPITFKIGNAGFNNAGTNYTTSYTSASTWTNNSGYISDIWGDMNLGFIGKTFGGSTTTKLYDMCYLASGTVYIYGGYYANGLDAGAFFVNLNNTNAYSNAVVGARLAY